VATNVALDEFHLFDGEHVPFASGTFDVTLLAYVLHHAPDPLALLREASRVSRRAVIVVEDTPRCAADRAWGHVHVHGFNGAYGLPLGHVRSEDEWLPIFADAGLRVTRRVTMARFDRFPPNARTQYTLVRDRRER
jgi:SAM-dependent methyltransferase